ncbi:hypothetical protein BH10ACT3_BH10ACT3_22460 [soil metagenome]
MAKVKDRRGKVVHAAGGVVWRFASTRATTPDPGAPSDPATLAGVEFVIVHRPRYDDWSLPKGKAESGESAQQTALREVEEETGLRCSLGGELATVRYETSRGEDKTVRWWSMTVDRDHGFEPNDEVDEVRWVGLSEFEPLSQFPTDLDVVHSLATSGALKPQL